MTASNFITDIAKYGLENDQDRLLASLNELIDHSKKSKKINLALQLQSILKDSIRQQQTSGLLKVGSAQHYQREEDREVGEFILEKLTSDYHFDSLVCTESVKEELAYFIQEHQALDLLHKFELPVSNRVLFYGPPGCGKTLASYVLAGELEKMMLVVNLGAIVSSKLGETSKNLAKVFRRASSEECIVFIDEFDTLGKVRDYSQDHGEMKRVVNTLLQLFDYLPSSSVIIAATNQVDMIDEALLRRFDVKINLELPDEKHILELIKKTLGSDLVSLDKQNSLSSIVEKCKGLSYYGIQRTLITAIKRSVITHSRTSLTKPQVKTSLWLELIDKEKRQFLSTK
jgi:SpoVK/Ycf46/Vps4 family AAA+-type ATPase